MRSQAKAKQQSSIQRRGERVKTAIWLAMASCGFFKIQCKEGCQSKMMTNRKCYFFIAFMHVVYIECLDQTLEGSFAFDGVIDGLLVKADGIQAFTDLVFHVKEYFY